MDTEKFDIKKFIGSFAQWLPWVKTFRYAIGIALIFGVILTVYFKFFAKSQTMKTVFTGQVGTVNVIQNKKKALIPFIEPYIDQSRDRKFNTGIRAGIRWEF